MSKVFAGSNPRFVRYTDVGPGVTGWFGLRYAHVPQRFGRPQRVDGQLQVDRLEEVPVFPQAPSRLNAFMGQGRPNPQSEQAHYINVWAPEDAEGLPVLFFIHGGAWMTGGGSEAWYDGARLSSLGVVVVTMNYRLGPLGHLGVQPSMDLPLPLEDLLLALHWTVDNIASYGGNPELITLVGQSAGGWYGHVLSMLDATRGMTHQVAHLSMGTRTPWEQARQQQVHQSAATHHSDVSLQNLTPEQLLQAGSAALQAERNQPGPPELAYAASGYLPVQTRDLPTDLFDPARATQKTHASAVYVRWTSDESAAFMWNSDAHLTASQEQVDRELSNWAVADLPDRLLRNGTYNGSASGLSPYRQLVAASSWKQFQRFPSEYAVELEAIGVPTQVDVFTKQSPLPNLHSAHCFDLPFQFGNWQAWQDAPMLKGIAHEEFAERSRQLMQRLVGFVHQREPVAD